jgi:hypothetical protein
LQRRPLAVHRQQQQVGVVDLRFERLAALLGQLGVAEAVVADGVAVRQQTPADLGAGAELGLALGVDAADVAPHLEEGARHVVLLEDGDDLVGVLRMRAVVEGQRHRLGRKFVAEDLLVAVLRRQLRGGIRNDQTLVAQDVLAPVQGLEMGDVVLPLLALGHDGALLEMAEDLRDLAVVLLLDVSQRVEIVADALVQLDRRQAAVLRHHALQPGQRLAERQAVGVVPGRIGLDGIQHRLDPAVAVGRAAGDHLAEGFHQLVLVLQLVVEQDLPGGNRRLAVGIGQSLLVGQQHDDAPVIGQQALQLALCHGVRIRLGRGRRRNSGVELGLPMQEPAAAGQAGDDKGHGNGPDQDAPQRHVEIPLFGPAFCQAPTPAGTNGATL